MDTVIPFFEPLADKDGTHAYAPTRLACGFWGPQDNLHARVVIGLLAHEIERAFGEPAFHPARLTVDLYRLPDLSPVTVATRLVRQGGRIKVVDAELFSNGVSSARATCQLLRRTEQPPGRIWRGSAWNVPAPSLIPPPDGPPPLGGRWEMRQIPNPGASGPEGPTLTPRRTWLREIRDLVAGVPHTPFTRVATGVDYASPVSNASETGLGFINSDVTLYLHRPPEGEWVGYEVTNHQSSDGIAIGQCTLHDLDGPFGYAACAALAQKLRT